MDRRDFVGFIKDAREAFPSFGTTTTISNKEATNASRASLNDGGHVAALTTNRNSSYGRAHVTPMLILDDSKVEEALDGRG